MRGRGNAPRDWLYSFMRHWLGSMLKMERPDLCRCLPWSFAIGHRLPDGTHPRNDRVGCDWDPQRVTGRRPWAWLARRGMADVDERDPGGGKQIEKLICELYGLTKKEFQLVEDDSCVKP